MPLLILLPLFRKAVTIHGGTPFGVLHDVRFWSFRCVCDLLWQLFVLRSGSEGASPVMFTLTIRLDLTLPVLHSLSVAPKRVGGV